ncbi:unnamed protein product [Schistosoma turkestanicum]|nr:unnamed protein product [Schistosoma turkestanicum]
MALICRALKSIFLDFFGRVQPVVFVTETAMLYPAPFLGTLTSWIDSIYFAVPKKRRTIEQRRIRKFLSLKSDEYKPRDDLTPCKFCGYLNPRNFICTNCYSKVREETNFLRSLVNGKLPSDREVRFVYDGDNSSTHAATPNDEEVKVSGSRPSWFPSILQKNRSSGGSE